MKVRRIGNEVAKVLKVPSEAIKNFDEEAAINSVANTVNNHDNATGTLLFMYYPAFNPIDKIVQLYDEKIELCERMLKEKSEVLKKSCWPKRNNFYRNIAAASQNLELPGAPLID